MKKNFFIFCLIVLFGVGASWAQSSSSVSGFVRDVTLGERLILANLRIKETNIGAATNTSGYYTITGLEAGTYVIVASYIGYQSLKFTVELSENQQIRFDVELEPSGFEVGDVVVTAEGETEEKQRQLGATKMSTATIRKLPTILEPDVFRSPQLLPGVKAASDFSSGLYIRGGSPDQTLILLDRTAVYSEEKPVVFGLDNTFAEDLESLFGGMIPTSLSIGRSYTLFERLDVGVHVIGVSDLMMRFSFGFNVN